MDDLYAREKLERAAQILATSPKDLHERIFDAVYEIGVLRPEHFSETLRPEFIELKQIITQRGSLQETISHLSADELVAVATRIWRLYEDLTRASPDRE